MMQLTEGALERMLKNEEVHRPILQITGMKRVDAGQGTPRFRLTLNDGRHSTSSALLATQKNEIAARGELDLYAVVDVVEFICNTVQNRRLIMLLEFNILRRGDEVSKELGSPMPLQMDSLAASATAQADSGNGTASASNNGTFGGQKQLQLLPDPLGPPLMRDPVAGGDQRSVAITHHVATGNGNIARLNSGQSMIFPLNSITPYQNKWSVRVRVTKKNPIKTYHNSRGEGKLFSVDMADESGEMRATAFNQECDTFFNTLNEGSVYIISGGQIKAANRQYSSINNDYELTFNSSTKIEPCFDDSIFQLPTVTFNFVKLDKLEKAPKDKIIDVVGVVESFSQCQTIMSRKLNTELKKRDVRLVDDSLNSVALTLWGEEAEKFDPDAHPVLAVKGVRISDFNGISLTSVQGSQLHLNPDVPEAHRLRGWYDSNGNGAQMNNLTSGGGGPAFSGAGFTTIALAEADHLGTGEKPDYYCIKGFVASVKRENCLYKACPSDGCNKKLIDQPTGRYRCERCNKEFDRFNWRLMLQITIGDFSGTQQVTLFNDQGEQLIGMTSKELADLKEQSEDEFNATLDKPLFGQYAFGLRAKMELYNDETRVKVMCSRVNELNVTDYCKFLTDEIQKMSALPDAD